MLQVRGLWGPGKCNRCPQPVFGCSWVSTGLVWTVDWLQFCDGKYWYHSSLFLYLFIRLLLICQDIQDQVRRDRIVISNFDILMLVLGSRHVKKLHPFTGTEALYKPYSPWGNRGIALPFHDHSTRRVWGVSVMPQPLFTPAKDSVPIVQEAGWAPGPVWTGAENLVPTGIQSPDHPTRSQSLYWLCYVAHGADMRMSKFAVTIVRLLSDMVSLRRRQILRITDVKMGRMHKEAIMVCFSHMSYHLHIEENNLVRTNPSVRKRS
jgi:hypothetical protein